MSYKIRTAVRADEEKIRGLFLEMLRSIYGKDEMDGYPSGALDRYWSAGEDRIFVAEDGEVIAFLSVEVHREDRDYLYLDDFSVTEAYRNRGIGTVLIGRAESYAEELGISAVLLHVEKTNGSAMRLYNRLGYAVFRDDGYRYLLYKDPV